MKPTLSVRIEKKMYARVCEDVNKNAYVVSKALSQYYRSKEPNEKLFTETQTMYANAYNQDLVSTLQLQIQDLKDDKEHLRSQNNALMLSSIPLLSRIKIKLLTK
jgi:hypothetical protein